MRLNARRDHRRGSSLVEVLVVIVIFAVGILAVAQIFPRGLGILKISGNITVGNSIARAELERLKSSNEQIATAIVANNDDPGQGVLFADIDTKAMPNDWLPSGVKGLSSAGVMSSDYGTGDWQLYTGANRFRGIIGEGRTVPAPRFVRWTNSVGDTENIYGGLISLQFAPVRISSNAARPTFLVYGADLQKRETEDFPRRFQDYVVYVDRDANQIYLPQGPARTITAERRYRVSYTYYVEPTSGKFEARSFTDVVPVASANGRQSYVGAAFRSNNSEAIAWVDYDSIRVQRLFEDRTALGFTDATADPRLRSDAAYEFRVLDPNLGLIICNPAGFEFQELRGRGRVPLTARIDYNVLDWRIIRDDFRVPDGARDTNGNPSPPYQQQLAMRSLKVNRSRGADLRQYAGVIDPTIYSFPTRANATDPNPEVVLIDRESGTMVDPRTSYKVDLSRGIVNFIDVDNDNSNGLTSDLVYPGGTTVERVPDIRGRSIRALYQVNGDWAVQPIKAVNNYFVAYAPSITYDQCYPGFQNGVDGSANEIYFPLADVGKTVVIGEVRYTDSDGVSKALYDQEFIIREPRQTGGLRLGRVVLADKADGSKNPVLDFSKGFAVRRVRGVSVSVRVFWNSTTFKLSSDDTQNMTELNKWLQSLRKTQSETFLVKGDVNQ